MIIFLEFRKSRMCWDTGTLSQLMFPTHFTVQLSVILRVQSCGRKQEKKKKLKIVQQLPRLASLYNSRRSDDCYYKLERHADKGTCMMAAKDIDVGEVILVEAALGRQSANHCAA